MAQHSYDKIVRHARFGGELQAYGFVSSEAPVLRDGILSAGGSASQSVRIVCAVRDEDLLGSAPINMADDRLDHLAQEVGGDINNAPREEVRRG